MLRRTILLLWLILTALSFVGMAGTVRFLLLDPGLRGVRSAATAEIIAATERMLAAEATPEAIEERLRWRLAETPRNWLALDALIALAAERNIALTPALAEEVARLRAEDFSLMAGVMGCGACMLDAGACTINQVMLCQAPIALTPIGDVVGTVRAGTAYLSGGEIDEIDLALSVVGLGATAAVLTSGGTSAVVKAGAGLAKSARKMGRLSPRLVDMARQAVAEGVDWAALPAVRSLDDLRLAIRVEKFTALTDTVTDLGRLGEATDMKTVLHLLPMVDNADDARRLADVGQALGPKVVGRAEILGKARLFRAAFRLTDMAWALVTGLLACAACVAGVLGHAVEAALRRSLWRMATR